MYPIILIVLTIIATVATSASHAFDQPKRKSGLWEMNVTSSRAKGTHTMQMCIDEKTDEVMSQQAAGMGKQACTKNDIRKDRSTYIGESVCRFGSTTATTRAVFTGKFDSSYRVEATTTYAPPMAGMSQNTMVIDAKWTGPCKPGQKPGDVTMPGMDTMNMTDKLKGMPKDKPKQ